MVKTKLKQSNFTAYEILVALFITVLIVSNIASTKIVHFYSLTFDAGTILFPLAYIVGDIITEIYGFRKMRRLIYLGIAMLILMTLTFYIVGLLPHAIDWTGQDAYNSILGVVWRIVGASIIALFFGEFFNSYILAKLKIQTKGKGIWGRVVGSTAIGSLIDTTLFSTIAFAGTMSSSTLIQLIATVYLVKVVTEIVVSPVTLQIIAYIKKTENIDTFEAPALSLTN
jgi:uncharacterized integral membrane protein (TIGR00697 family)